MSDRTRRISKRQLDGSSHGDVGGPQENIAGEAGIFLERGSSDHTARVNTEREIDRR